MQFALNLRWQITAWDHTLQTESGFSRSEVLGLNFVENLVVSKDRDHVSKILKQAYGQDDVYEFPFTLYSKSGAPIMLLLDISPVFDHANSVGGVAIFAQQPGTTSTVGNCGTMHFALDSKRRLCAWNRALERSSGFTRDDALGLCFGDFVTHDILDDFDEMIHEVCEKSKLVRDYSFILFSKVGKPIRMLLNPSPCFAEEIVKPIGVSIFARLVPHEDKEGDPHVARTIKKASEVLQGRQEDLGPSRASTAVPSPSMISDDA